MPYEVFTRDGLMRLTLTGVISGEDVKGWLPEVARQEEEGDRAPDRIVDLSAVTGFTLNFTWVSFACNNRKTANVRNPCKSAVVAPSWLHYGFARMYQSMGEHPSITIEVFRNLPDAEAWIAAGKAA